MDFHSHSYRNEYSGKMEVYLPPASSRALYSEQIEDQRVKKQKWIDPTIYPFLYGRIKHMK